jgi:hypothetical protein
MALERVREPDGGVMVSDSKGILDAQEEVSEFLSRSVTLGQVIGYGLGHPQGRSVPPPHPLTSSGSVTLLRSDGDLRVQNSALRGRVIELFKSMNWSG